MERRERSNMPGAPVVQQAMILPLSFCQHRHLAFPKSGPGWRVYQTLGDFVDPGPSQTWVLMDEREDSINDGYFVVDMIGFPNDGSRFKIVDFPASYHNQAGGLSFADGHSEIKKWSDARTVPVLKPGRELSLNIASPNNRDVFWMQE